MQIAASMTSGEEVSGCPHKHGMGRMVAWRHAMGLQTHCLNLQIHRLSPCRNKRNGVVMPVWLRGPDADKAMLKLLREKHALQFLETFQYTRNAEETKRCEGLSAPFRGSNDVCSLETCANFKPRLPTSTLGGGRALSVRCAFCAQMHVLEPSSDKRALHGRGCPSRERPGEAPVLCTPRTDPERPPWTRVQGRPRAHVGGPRTHPPTHGAGAVSGLRAQPDLPRTRRAPRARRPRVRPTRPVARPSAPRPAVSAPAAGPRSRPRCPPPGRCARR